MTVTLLVWHGKRKKAFFFFFFFLAWKMAWHWIWRCLKKRLTQKAGSENSYLRKQQLKCFSNVNGSRLEKYRQGKPVWASLVAVFMPDFSEKLSFLNKQIPEGIFEIISVSLTFLTTAKLHCSFWTCLMASSYFRMVWYLWEGDCMV